MLDHIKQFGPMVFFTVLLFPLLTGADNYLYEKGFIPAFPSLSLFFLMVVPVAFKHLLENGATELIRAYRDTAWITVPFGLIGLMALLWGAHPGAYWVDGPRNTYVDLMNWLFLIFAITIATSETVKKNYRLIFFIVLLGAGIAIWVDITNPGLLSDRSARAVGFGKHPNTAASGILFLTIASVNWEKNSLWDMVAFLVGAICIYATFSIGVLIFLALVFAVYLVLNLIEKGSILKKVSLGIFIPLGLLTFSLLVNEITQQKLSTTDEIGQLMTNRRQSKFENMKKGDLAFAKEHSRWALITEYIDLIGEAPFYGKGTGWVYTQPPGKEPHNMFLKHGAEHGILGFSAYLLFIGGTFYHFRAHRSIAGQVLVLAILLNSFYTHNLLYYRSFIVILGTYAVIVCQPAPRHQKTVNSPIEVAG